MEKQDTKSNKILFEFTIRHIHLYMIDKPFCKRIDDA